MHFSFLVFSHLPLNNFCENYSGVENNKKGMQNEERNL